MSPNELDDFLKRKEAEFDVPFREEYWEKAQELLQRERRHRPAAFWNARTLGLTGAVTLLGGMAVWYLLSTNPVSTESNNNSVVNASVEPTPYFESRDNAVATKNDAAIYHQGASTSAEENSPATTVSTTTKSNSANSTTFNHNATNTNTAAASSSVNNRTSNNNPSVGSTTRANTRSTNQSNTFASHVVDVRSDILALRSLNQRRISYRNDHLIPVFEDMTPNDPALLRFYGLYYKSTATPSRKIREFKHGAQFPQITWAAVGGLNVFNHLKEHSDSLSYISTNPYLGVKLGYQWNPKWGICIQPTLAQRGGVRLYDNSIVFVPSDKVTAYRHLYYMQIPVTLGVNLTKSHNVSFGGGASVLLATGSRLQAVETKKVEGPYKVQQSDMFKRVDYFATAGYHFRMNKKIGLQASFKYGLTDVTRNVGDSNHDHHNIQASLGMTYQFYQEKLQLR